MRGAERSIETGEYLDSALWQDERHRVQIGTVHKINRIPRGQLRADANVLPRSGVMELAHEVGRNHWQVEHQTRRRVDDGPTHMRPPS